MLFLQDIYHIIGMEQDTSYMLLKKFRYTGRFAPIRGRQTARSM